MVGFIIRRILWGIPVLLVVIFMTYGLMSQIEGNPFRRTERAITPAQQAALEQQFNLDKPWYMQYALYVKGVFTYDLGNSLTTRNRAVTDIIEDHFPPSIQLGLGALLMAVVVGIPLGIVSALRHNTVIDYLAMFFSNVGYAIPTFLSGTLLIYLFAIRWGDTFGLPTSGWSGPEYKILPIIALGIVPTAYFARLVRGTILETLQEDYVRTAKAKGLRHKQVIAGHVLRNSLIPVVTVAGPTLGFLITGSFVIELIFDIPGIGRYYVDSVESRDYSVTMGLTVLLSAIIIAANIVVDILYAFLDPRTREGGNR